MVASIVLAMYIIIVDHMYYIDIARSFFGHNYYYNTNDNRDGIKNLYLV